MIEDAVARIQAIEQKLTEKTQTQLQARLTIRGCLKELRTLCDTETSNPDIIDGRRLEPA